MSNPTETDSQDWEISNHDGGITVSLFLGLEITERLVNILAGYTEMQRDKVDMMRDDEDDEYTEADLDAAEENLAAAETLFPIVVNAYSEGIAASYADEAIIDPPTASGDAIGIERGTA